MPAIRKGMDIKQVGSYLNAYGYKIVRKEGNEEGGVDLTAMELANIDHLFAKQGERPDIMFKFVEERPKGTIGRKDFQIEHILEMKEEDVKFVKKVMKTYLQLDPGIDMNKAKGKNLKGPRQRVIQKVLAVIGEFEVFNKSGYWPLEEFMLAILKSTSQTYKGYGQQSLARKKEQEAAGARDPTNNHTRPSGSKIGRPRKHPLPPTAIPSPENSESRVDTEATQDATPQDAPPAESDENERIDHGKDADVDEGEDIGKVVPGDIGKGTSTDAHEDKDTDNNNNKEFEHPMDISMRVVTHSDAPRLSNKGEDEVLEGFGNMSLDPSQDYEAEGPGSSSDLILTPDTLIPAFSHSRTNPFTPSGGPRRKLVRGQQGSFESQDHHRPTTHPATPPRPQSFLASAPPLGSAPTTNATLVPASPATAPSGSESIEGITPDVLSQLASLPVSVLVTLPPALQAAVAGWKAARSILGLGSLPAPTSAPPPTVSPAPTSAPTPTVSPAPTSTPPPKAPQFRRPRLKVPPQATPTEVYTSVRPGAKTVPADRQFDDANYDSDPPSASESNRPINYRPKGATAAAILPVAKAGKAIADTETGAPTATAQPHNKQAVAKTGGANPGRAGPQDAGPHEPEDNVGTVAGLGNSGEQAGRGASTGNNRAKGRKVEAETNKPISQGPKRALRSTTVKNNTTMSSK